MTNIINKLTDKQKEELTNALWKVDQIFEDVVTEDDDYHGTDFYTELYKIMFELGQWC